MTSTGGFDFTPGMNLLVKLYAGTSSVLANGAGDNATEDVTDDGWYTFSVAEALSGSYRAAIINLATGNVVGRGHCRIVDGGTFKIVLAGIDELLARSTTVVVSATAVSAVALSDSGRITIVTQSTFRIQLTGLGDLSDRVALHFTIKRSLEDEDENAVVHITEEDGLDTVEEETAVDSSLGSLTVDDEADGDVTIYLDEEATALLVADEDSCGLYYSVKVFRSGTSGDADELINFRNPDVRADIIQGVDRHLT